VPPRSALAIAAPSASRASTTGNAQSSGPASLSPTSTGVRSRGGRAQDQPHRGRRAGRDIAAGPPRSAVAARRHVIATRGDRGAGPVRAAARSGPGASRAGAGWVARSQRGLHLPLERGGQMTRTRPAAPARTAVRWTSSASVRLEPSSACRAAKVAASDSPPRDRCGRARPAGERSLARLACARARRIRTRRLRSRRQRPPPPPPACAIPPGRHLLHLACETDRKRSTGVGGSRAASRTQTRPRRRARSGRCGIRCGPGRQRDC